MRRVVSLSPPFIVDMPQLCVCVLCGGHETYAACKVCVCVEPERAALIHGSSFFAGSIFYIGPRRGIYMWQAVSCVLSINTSSRRASQAPYTTTLRAHPPHCCAAAALRARRHVGGVHT